VSNHEPKTLAQISDEERLQLLFAVKCGYQLEHYYSTTKIWERSILDTDQQIKLIEKRSKNFQYRIARDGK